MYARNMHALVASRHYVVRYTKPKPAQCAQCAQAAQASQFAQADTKHHGPFSLARDNKN